MTRSTIDPDAAANTGREVPTQRGLTCGYTGDLLSARVHTTPAGTAVLELVGEIDLVTVPMLHDRVMAELDLTPHQLVLDLRQVGFIGSSGLAELVEIRTEAMRRNVGLRLVSDSRAVLRPLVATGLIELFAVSADLGPAAD